jgi:hypothetical protein
MSPEFYTIEIKYRRILQGEDKSECKFLILEGERHDGVTRFQNRLKIGPPRSY